MEIINHTILYFVKDLVYDIAIINLIRFTVKLHFKHKISREHRC